MRNISGRFVQEIDIHILCPVFFSLENRAVYGLMWKNMVEPDRPYITILHMRIACWITKATNTYSEYVM
jgi:hypothetical protein